jgi:hypothetical protein
MERLSQLIGKLNEQFEQNADLSQLLMTTQLIESELVRLSSAYRQTLGTSKVAVVMPAGGRRYNSAIAQLEKVEEKAISIPVEIVEKNVAIEKNGVYNDSKKEQKNGWNIDPLREIPTLAHQEVVKELNEIMASNQSSLNDKLKEEVIEIGHLLTDSPVRDLKRAIGINDRFVFISELFRGDEVMYERSIKTINGFRIFPEAQYWIERELKVKLGWDESKECTRHFHQLVKRRFS